MDVDSGNLASSVKLGILSNAIYCKIMKVWYFCILYSYNITGDCPTFSRIVAAAIIFAETKKKSDAPTFVNIVSHIFIHSLILFGWAVFSRRFYSTIKPLLSSSQ